MTTKTIKPMKHLTQGEQRFRKFQAWLKQETGDRCYTYAANRVIVRRNEFSPERDFPSVQAAIDHFAYLMKGETI